MKYAVPFMVVVVISVFVAVPSLLAEDPAQGAIPEANAQTDVIVAIYFHGNVRCATCRKIEAYADEAIAQGFADEVASGRVEWRAVNLDEPDNKHFIDDFQLITKSVVLVEYRDGEVTRWQNLDKVWQLVRNKEDFVAYVQDGTREFIGAS